MMNNIVLFGGIDSNGMENNLLNIYNLEKGIWQQKELKGEPNEIPGPRSSHTANAIGRIDTKIQASFKIVEITQEVKLNLRISFIFLEFDG